MRKLAVVLLAFLGIGLAACNNEDPLQSDWIDHPTGVLPAPTSTPKPIPTPDPTISVTDLYTGPAEVEKYVVKFVDDAKIQGIDVTPDMKNPALIIQLATLDSYGTSVIGLCETGGSLRRVTFDPDFWNAVDETQRELLAHHEFGHCVLYRAHRSDLLSTGKYASVMYPIILGSSTYLANYDYYQNELFTQTAMSPEAELGVVTHVCDEEDLRGASESWLKWTI